MKKLLLLSLGIFLPVLVSAVTIAPADFYQDVRSSSHEAAAINLLTREGVVEGIGDRFFGPARQVNRAEFLKIAILSLPADRRPSVNLRECFPDVQASDWFSGTVCGAKDIGIVRGNADPTKPEEEWLFTPDAQVTYDAALKMLTLLFGYEVRSAASDEDWGQPYYIAARKRGVDLPIPIRFDTPLSRGMAARLAAAFMAENAGQLDELRMAENGEFTSASSESSSLSSSSSSSATSASTSTSTSTSTSSPTALFQIPTVSHLLLVGATSDAIAHGTIAPFSEEAEVTAVQVKLFQEARSLEALELVRTDGTLIARMKRRPNPDTQDYQVTYETSLAGTGIFLIPENTTTPVVLRAVVRARNNDGFSENLVQVRIISVTIRGKTTNTTYNIPLNTPFPRHQTAFGRLLPLIRTSPVSAPLQSGASKTIVSFGVDAQRVDTQTLFPMQFIFSYDRIGQLTMFSNWRLRRTDTNAEATCTMNTQELTISCANLQTILGALPSGILPLSLLADVQVATSTDSESFQVFLPTPGSPETLGSVWWTDGTGTFRWMEGVGALLTGTFLSK